MCFRPRGATAVSLSVCNMLGLQQVAVASTSGVDPESLERDNDQDINSLGHRTSLLCQVANVQFYNAVAVICFNLFVFVPGHNRHQE